MWRYLLISFTASLSSAPYGYAVSRKTSEVSAVGPDGERQVLIGACGLLDTRYGLFSLRKAVNAFKHGVSKKSEHRWLRGQITVGPSALEVTIANSKSGRPANAARGGIGLANLRKRLELLYPSRHHEPDVLFLDIEMPEMTGIEFLKALPQAPVTIFTTAYRNYAFEGYELGVIDFLLKAISYARFSQAIEKVRDFLHHLGIAPDPDREKLQGGGNGIGGPVNHRASHHDHSISCPAAIFVY